MDKSPLANAEDRGQSLLCEDSARVENEAGVPHLLNLHSGALEPQLRSQHAVMKTQCKTKSLININHLYLP